MDVFQALPDLPVVFLRSIGVAAMLPLMEGRNTVGLRFSLAFLFTFFCTGDVPVHSRNGLSLILEPGVGILIGLPIRLVIEACAGFGELLDTSRGQTVGNFYDPGSGLQQGLLSTFFRSWAWVLLLFVGGFETILESLVESFTVIPGGTVSVSIFFSSGTKICMLVAKLFGGMFSLVLPFSLLFLFIDIGVGVMGRVVPQAHLYSEGFQLKTYLAFVLLMVLTQFYPERSLEKALDIQLLTASEKAETISE